jgi:hypothetical protein
MADAEERETDASRGITTAVDGPKIVLGVGRGYIVGRRVASRGSNQPHCQRAFLDSRRDSVPAADAARTAGAWRR